MNDKLIGIKKCRWFILICFVASFCSADAQDTDTLAYPEMGKPMPDFVVRNIAYYPKKQATLADFRGKWLVLDFWDKTCGACVASFPHVNEIQKELSDKVQVMLVGIQDEQKEIQSLYAKYRERENLLMPCAFDSIIANRFDIGLLPHTIVIDNKGIVQCVTQSVNLEDMKSFLSGNPPNLRKAYYRASAYYAPTDKNERYAFNAAKPFLVGNNGGADTDFVFRSVLSKWNRDKQEISANGRIDENVATTGILQELGVSLEWLYTMAYFGQECTNYWSTGDTLHYGKYYHHPFLEIKDSSKFKPSYHYNRNLFSYSLIMPKEDNTKEKMQAAMKRDLQNYFGFEAFVETRKCPYWKLVAKPGAKEKLQTKGEPQSAKSIMRAGGEYTNLPFHDLFESMKNDVEGDYLEDETGITGNVDIKLYYIAGNTDDLKKALQANGLDLIRAKKDMKVLVIRDPKQPVIN